MDLSSRLKGNYALPADIVSRAEVLYPSGPSQVGGALYTSNPGCSDWFRFVCVNVGLGN